MHSVSPNQLTLPYIQTTDHLMPMGQGQLRGSGYLFTQTIADGLRAGSLWIVMVDSFGKPANAHGDIIMLATITEVDWLSEAEIKLDIAIHQWGALALEPHHSTTYLQGEIYPIWHDDIQLDNDDILTTRLRQWLAESGSQMQVTAASLTSARWVCWRWLELLPLSLTTKQRLLKHSSPQVCIRYLKKIIRRSDLITSLLR